MKKITTISLSHHIDEKLNFYTLWIHRGDEVQNNYMARPKNKKRIKRMQKLLNAWLWRK